MRNALIATVAVLALAGCTPAQQQQAAKSLASPPGQLFCAFQLTGGGAMVAGIVSTAATTAATAAVPGAGAAAGPVIALATDATKADVDQTCAAAAKLVPGATAGVPVSPPANPGAAPTIAAPLPPTLPTTTG